MNLGCFSRYFPSLVISLQLRDRCAVTTIPHLPRAFDHASSQLLIRVSRVAIASLGRFAGTGHLSSYGPRFHLCLSHIPQYLSNSVSAMLCRCQPELDGRTLGFIDFMIPSLHFIHDIQKRTLDLAGSWTRDQARARMGIPYLVLPSHRRDPRGFCPTLFRSQRVNLTSIMQYENAVIPVNRRIVSLDSLSSGRNNKT